MLHVPVYREPGRFAGWLANYGIWSWGDEIVVGFTVGHLQTGAGFHARDDRRPFLPMQARSLDGGHTWTVAPVPCRTPGGRGFSADEHVRPELSAQDALARRLPHLPLPCPGNFDFTHPDFALLCARTGLGGGTVSWFYVSQDRCRSWQGPFALPLFDQTGVEARTDYLISGPMVCTLFLTAARADGAEGGGVFCARTLDGGRTFTLVSWIARAETGHVIMPASARLAPKRIAVAVRAHDGRGGFEGGRHWIDLYLSEDDGLSWRWLAQPAPDTGRGGNPPALTRLHDGRLCLTYGYRAAPFGIRARLSADDGVTWGEEITLRDDGGCHDLGYPRTVQRDDGTLVTVYYFNDQPDGERYIAATLWKP